MFQTPKGPWEIVRTAECPEEERWNSRHFDLADAEQFLRQFRSDFFVMSRLRSLAESMFHLVGRTDEEVIRQIAWRLHTRELVLRETFWTIQSEGGSGPLTTEESSPVNEPEPSQPVRSPKVEEAPPDTFDGTHDALAQAAALESAAADGIPFCEECARKAAA